MSSPKEPAEARPDLAQSLRAKLDDCLREIGKSHSESERLMLARQIHALDEMLDPAHPLPVS